MPSNSIARSADRLKRFFQSRRDNETYNGRVYRPLNPARQEIRLLVVKPGIGDEMLDCTFKYAYLNEVPRPQYETVSYVWGDATVRAILKIEGQSMYVPASSEKVLRRFRLAGQERILWIDAVCINQDDQEERSSQVALMYEIYSYPVKNLIWLGDDDGTARRALDGIHLLLNDMRVDTNDFTNTIEILYDKNGVIRTTASRVPFSLPPEQRDAMVQYYSSEWFRRLWVVQEAALAPSNVCYCGDTELPLQNVLLAATWMYHKKNGLPRALATLRGTSNALHMFQICGDRWTNLPSQGNTDLFSILINTGKFEVTDPRDKVFAILGLARKLGGVNEAPISLHPDYSKSVSAIFRDVTLHCIHSSRSLDILNFIRHRLPVASPRDLPTWVFACRQIKDPTIDANQLREEQYNACLGEKHIEPIPQQSQDRDLRAKGMVVGESEWVSRTLWRANFHDISRTKQSEIYLHVWPSPDETCAAFASPDRLELAMTLTAGCNHFRERWNNESCVRSSIAYDEVVEGEEVTDMRDLTATSTNDQRLAAEFDVAMYNALKNRCLFSTKSGQIGLGPQTMQSGDVVAILFGCRLPAILRRLDSNKDRYEFVGVCYVYGIMDGEAVEAHRAAGEEDVVFTLV